ncbi:hypothetical protein WJX84_008677 [Apatococcus fuscideae]|uniref:Gfo/Idh/MocA family oxidoreductase n=1 Tax=Apatococcus fuscideae TaxID=2026836 RepID=A0AAW1TC25_9CHLO
MHLVGTSPQITPAGRAAADDGLVFDTHKPSKESDATIRVAFIGAGGINFGKPGRPWNHVRAVSSIPGVQVVGIADPDTTLVRERIREKLQGPEADKWQDCEAFTDYHGLIAARNRPEAVIIGVPPFCHGGMGPDNCMELDLARAGIHLFVEKPVSIQSAEEVGRLSDALEECHTHNGSIVVVGYMLRYSAWIDAAKQLLKEAGAIPVAVVARMSAGHSFTAKPAFWDIARSGGPIVEQATHFIDLMRYICGEISADTIHAVALGPNLRLADMAPPPQSEHQVPMERRINRATAATWCFEGGAIGSLFHSIVLEGSRFTAELDIFCDGMHLVIGNPYFEPSLRVRRGRCEDYEQVDVGDGGDMFAEEMRVFIQAARTGERSLLRSTYSDAARSYQTSDSQPHEPGFGKRS